MAGDDGDVLSFGPPERGRSVALGVLVVGALVVGYLLGSRGGPGGAASTEASDPVDALVAGVVRESYPVGDDLAFDVVLRNGSARALEVTVLALGPLDVSQPEGPSSVPAHASRTLVVTVPTTCPGEPDGPAEVTAQVVAGEERRRVVLPVTEAGDFSDYLTALCAGPTRESRASLEGVWALERAFARWNRSEGSLLFWFRPDGTFVADDRGRLFSRDVVLTGEYDVRRSRLHLVTRAGVACAPEDGAVWDLHRRSDTLMSLRYVSGSCPREPGGVWVLRRVLESVPHGVTW
ncbi:MAG TPA: hypothetical protein VFV40_10690 [Nocardioides sp.]|nr:hypothetical protein [Nocardioides sp.]